MGMICVQPDQNRSCFKENFGGGGGGEGGGLMICVQPDQN